MGEGEAVQESGESLAPDQGEPALLAWLHHSKVQTAAVKDHPVPHPHEEAAAQETVSACR